MALKTQFCFAIEEMKMLLFAEITLVLPIPKFNVDIRNGAISGVLQMAGASSSTLRFMSKQYRRTPNPSCILGHARTTL
jgi:hypothetical protein